MTLTEISSRPRSDAAIAQILRATKESLGAECADVVQSAARVREPEAPRPAGGQSGRRISLKAADGSDLVEVLRVVVAAIRAGLSIDISLGRPLADRLHRGLVRADVSVRVETTERWVDRVVRSGDEVIVVGPERSRQAALRRARSSVGTSRAIVDVVDVDDDLLDAVLIDGLRHDAPRLCAAG